MTASRRPGFRIATKRGAAATFRTMPRSVTRDHSRAQRPGRRGHKATARIARAMKRWGLS